MPDSQSLPRLSDPEHFYAGGSFPSLGCLKGERMKDTGKAADFLIALAVVVISIVLWFQADKMPQSNRGIGPGDFPKFICVVLFVLGMIQLVSIVVRSKGIPLIDFKSVNVRYLVRVLIMLALTFVYYKLLKPVGFLLMTPVYLFASFILFGYRKKLIAAVVAVAFPVVVYFLFSRVFMVILPRGILG